MWPITIRGGYRRSRRADPGTTKSGLERTSKKAEGEEVSLSWFGLDVSILLDEGGTERERETYDFFDPRDDSAWGGGFLDDDLVPAGDLGDREEGGFEMGEVDACFVDLSLLVRYLSSSVVIRSYIRADFGLQTQKYHLSWRDASMQICRERYIVQFPGSRELRDEIPELRLRVYMRCLGRCDLGIFEQEVFHSWLGDRESI